MRTTCTMVPRTASWTGRGNSWRTWSQDRVSMECASQEYTHVGIFLLTNTQQQQTISKLWAPRQGVWKFTMHCSQLFLPENCTFICWENNNNKRPPLICLLSRLFQINVLRRNRGKTEQHCLIRMNSCMLPTMRDPVFRVSSYGWRNRGLRRLN